MYKQQNMEETIQIVHCKCAAVAFFFMNSKSGHLGCVAKNAKFRKGNKENVA